MASDVVSCRGRGRGRGFVNAWVRLCVEEDVELRVLQHTVRGIQRNERLLPRRDTASERFT